jgi:Na+-exporting ATPase
MVVRKLWVPSLDARPSERAPLSTARGQAYSLETASDPFYPRGEVRADPVPLRRSDVIDLKNKDQPKRSATQDSVDNEDFVVHQDELEHSLREWALCASLCNQATLHRSTEDDGKWEANGDPTEIALQVAAHKLGHGKPFLTHVKHHLTRTSSVRSDKPVVAGMKGHYEQLVEHPFDSTVKRMAIAYIFHPEDKSEGHILCMLKGAVERVLERCTTIHDERLTETHQSDIISKMDALAAQGLRVLGLASRRVSLSSAEKLKSMPRDEFEAQFSFLGLAGIFDPPRPESAGAVAECLRAGITPRMLTGDHPATATAIALSIGILPRTYPKEAVMTGPQFDALSNEQIDELSELPLVVARCAPETKVRMVDAIHRREMRTVMTGDGVNDAPSLKRADVGVGMGSGSDVAKQSSNLVLADDNFATICRAIRKGRSVFKNLAKFLLVRWIKGR